jgi:hypothetical protein
MVTEAISTARGAVRFLAAARARSRASPPDRSVERTASVAARCRTPEDGNSYGAVHVLVLSFVWLETSHWP